MLIGFALANAVAFRMARFDLRSPPLIARAMAILSIGLWLAAAALGRWIAYG
ncbi:hypothetical protein ABC347_08485 [Sphingomonas sp. 1P06PA]|uniref:hypothetical protein n=1 Tax=Sphingomonas sp. 1P06PA TaxID=554121 RepID=UPI0039A7577B